MLMIDMLCRLLRHSAFVYLKKTLYGQPTVRSSAHIVTLVYKATIVWRFYCPSRGLKRRDILVFESRLNIIRQALLQSSFLVLSVAPDTNGFDKHGFDFEGKLIIIHVRMTTLLLRIALQL